jgi:DNA repair protein RecO (recombination protein O)
MPVYKANGIVLHRFSLGETDRVLTLFTRETGKVSAVAKGSRRPGSRFSGATELFTCARMLLAVGKSFDIVSQCEISESFPGVRADLGLLARATYLCELTDRLTEDREPDPELFDLLLSALYLLQRKSDAPDAVTHAFELRALEQRGYAPVLERCVKCDAPPGRGRLGFSPALGGVLCAEHRFAADDAIQIIAPTLQLLSTLARAEPEDIIALTPEPRAMAEADRCLRRHIRYRTERELKSAEFLDILRLTPVGS